MDILNKLSANIGVIDNIPFEVIAKFMSGIGFHNLEVCYDRILDFCNDGNSIETARHILEDYNIHPVSLYSMNEKFYSFRSESCFIFENMKILCDMAVLLNVECICIKFIANENRSLSIENFYRLCEIADKFRIKVAVECTDLNDLSNIWDVVKNANCYNGGLLLNMGGFSLGRSNPIEVKCILKSKVFITRVGGALETKLNNIEGKSKFINSDGCCDINGLNFEPLREAANIIHNGYTSISIVLK